jgi:hypothetical protein
MTDKITHLSREKNLF